MRSDGRRGSPVDRVSLFRRAAAVAALAMTPVLIGSIAKDHDFNARVLAAHNHERLSAGVPPLQWNSQLSASASRWADHLGKTGEFSHSPDEVGQPVEGENLWAGSRGYYTPESMVGLWTAEKSDFKPGVFPANSRTADVEKVGHYTQLMWRRTTSVGCAVAQSRVEDVLVCRYSSAGNVVGEQPF
jgi:hypothetical protein